MASIAYSPAGSAVSIRKTAWVKECALRSRIVRCSRGFESCCSRARMQRSEGLRADPHDEAPSDRGGDPALRWLCGVTDAGRSVTSTSKQNWPCVSSSSFAMSLSPSVAALPSVLCATGAPANFRPITLEASASVVAAVRPTAEKLWNVELRLAPTHTALPQDVQDAVARDYGADERPQGVYHKGIVSLVADVHGGAALRHHATRPGRMPDLSACAGEHRRVTNSVTTESGRYPVRYPSSGIHGKPAYC